MEQKNKSRSRKLVRTTLISCGALLLVAGTVSALTLDTTIVRNIPYFERLLITIDGDSTSTPEVELSGTANNLIKLPSAVGTDDVLKAPIGNFLHLTTLTGNAFALGTLTTDLFSFDITSYYLTFIGAGGFSDGSCGVGEAIVGFSGGTAICESASLVSILPPLLCTTGDVFVGRLGIGIPSCASGTGGSYSLSGGDYRQISPIVSSDIYYPRDSGTGCSRGATYTGVDAVCSPGSYRDCYFTGSTTMSASGGTAFLVAGYYSGPLSATGYHPGYGAYPSCGCDISSDTQDCIVDYSTSPPVGISLSPALSPTRLSFIALGIGYSFDENTGAMAGAALGQGCFDYFLSGGVAWVNTFTYVSNISEETRTACSNGSGNVGVGLDTPLAKLHVYSQSTADFSVSCDSGGASEGTGLVSYHPAESTQFGVCTCDVNIDATDPACSVSRTYSLPYDPSLLTGMYTGYCEDVDLTSMTVTLHTMSQYIALTGRKMYYNPLPGTVSGVYLGSSISPGQIYPRCSCDTTSLGLECPPIGGLDFSGTNVGDLCMDASGYLAQVGYYSIKVFPISWYQLLGTGSSSGGGSCTSGGTISGTGSNPTFRVDNNGILTTPYIVDYSTATGGMFAGYIYSLTTTGSSNISGSAIGPRCGCDISDGSEDCGAASTLIDSHAPTGYVVGTPNWTCFDNYTIGASMYYDEYTSYASGSIFGYERPIESPIVNLASTGGSSGTGYYYQPILSEPDGVKIPDSCHIAGAGCTSFSPNIITLSTYRAIDIIDANNARFFKEDPLGADTDILDTGYVRPISGAVENYGSPIPRCSCGTMGEGPITRSTPSFGCMPSGSPDPISLPDTAPYCVDVVHVGGYYYGTDTPPYNSTYSIILLKRLYPAGSGSLVMTGSACSCDVGSSEDCLVQHPTSMGNELLGMSPIPFPYTSTNVTSPTDFTFEGAPGFGYSCYDSFSSGLDTYYHTYAAQIPVYSPLLGPAAPNAYFTPVGGAGIEGALSIPYAGENIEAIGGRVGINTNTPTTGLEIVGNLRFRTLATSDYTYLGVDTDGTLVTTGGASSLGGEQWGTHTYLSTPGIHYNGGDVGIQTTTPGATLHVSGDILTNATYIVSDRNQKTNILPLGVSVLTSLMSINGYTFTWIATQRDDIGVLAQEVESVFPDLVKTIGEGQSALKSVEYPNLMTAAVKALQQIDAMMLDAGTAKLAEQNREIQILQTRITDLEKGKTWDPRNPPPAQ